VRVISNSFQMTQKLTITFLSDPVCPYCFLGKRKLEAAMAQFPNVEFQIEYRPFQLNPNATKRPKRPYLESKFGGPERTAMIFSRMELMGKEWGIQFQFDGIDNNTFNSHRLLSFAKQFGIASNLKDQLLSAYHEQGLDIGDLSVLATLFEQAGGEKEVVKFF
jgi:predicted DsbA family dithiol-disulfide isomerase